MNINLKTFESELSAGMREICNRDNKDNTITINLILIH